MVENERGETQLLNKLTFRPTMKDRLLKGKRDVVLTRVVDSKALEGSPTLASRRSTRQSISNPSRAAVTTMSTNSKEPVKGGNISKEEKASNIEKNGLPSSNATSSKSAETGIKNIQGKKTRLQRAIDGFNSKERPSMYNRSGRAY